MATSFTSASTSDGSSTAANRAPSTRFARIDIESLMGTLLSAVELDEWLAAAEDVAIFDCRYSLADPSWGQARFAEGHLPTARFLDVGSDLSSEVQPGITGRHPLPSLDGLARKLGALGVGEGTRVVAYDQGNGMFAARLWWLCNFLGHSEVWVLDGGVTDWLEGGRRLETRVTERAPRDFSTLYLHAESIAAVDEVEALAEHPEARLFDARSAERFRGENETIDPVAGHIPGAISLPFERNLDGVHFKSRDELRATFTAALDGSTPEQAIAYCGSGITACHLVLAAEHAGLSGMRLYPGSFSEWITEPTRRVATGA
jgi:thiosulfate/3-mercaptopyruvate sulfurtransferase